MNISKSVAKQRPKRSAQLNFRIEEELSAALDAAASEEQRDRADLARLIFEWGFAQYRNAGSYEGLRSRGAAKLDAKKGRAVG